MKELFRYVFIVMLVVSTFAILGIAFSWMKNPDPNITLLSESLAIALSIFVASYIGEKKIMAQIVKEDSDIKNSKEFTIRFSHATHIIFFLFLASVVYLIFGLVLIGNPPIKLLIAALFLLTATLLHGTFIFLRSGDPKLKLSRKGVFIGGYGMIPWSSVDGIHSTFYEKGGCIAQFKIKNMDNLQHQMDVLAKLARKIRQKNLKDVIHVKVGTRASERSVADLAINLWEEATGKKYLWHPNMSEEVLASMQRQPQLLADLEVAAKNNNPELLKITMENIDKDLDTVKNYAEKRSKEAKKSLWILVAIILSYFAFLTMKYLT